MATIEVQQIATNRYAPAGADAVRLYGVNGADGLTLAQLVAAVCIRRSAHLEARAVGRMNRMTKNNAWLEALGNVCKQVADGAELHTEANIPAAYEPKHLSHGRDLYHFLMDECRSLGFRVTDFGYTPTYQQRMDIIGKLKTGMDKANTTSQEDAIELQSMINWRDVTYNASSGIISRYGNSGMNMAGNI